MNRFKHIVLELKSHSPFTIFGAVMGIVFVLIFRNFTGDQAHGLFLVFHPMHTFLSAVVTASLFRMHEKTRNFLIVFLVGWLGAVGITTLSDSVIPFLGESILGVALPTHADIHAAHDHSVDHENEHADSMQTHDHDHHAHDHQAHDHVLDHNSQENSKLKIKPKLHIGFIEDWYIVNPAAVLGIIFAYFLPYTKLPHAGHVLISTWASSSHILMNTSSQWSAVTLTGVLAVLFIAVWIPCCVSDIVFPLLFIRDKDQRMSCPFGHSHNDRKSEDE